MKKKIFGSLAVLAIVTVAALNFSINQNGKMSLLALANVEALAQDESGKEKWCSRVSVAKSCYSKGVWVGMSIKLCEKYKHQIPMICDSCMETNCPSGSSE